MRGKKIKSPIRYLEGRDYTKPLKLFDPDEIHKTIFGLNLSNKDTAMVFVKSIMGGIGVIHGISPYQIIVSDLKRAGVEIDHDKYLIKGVDVNYPEEIGFLNELAAEHGGGYSIDYADINKDDEWARWLRVSVTATISSFKPCITIFKHTGITRRKTLMIHSPTYLVAVG